MLLSIDRAILMYAFTQEYVRSMNNIVMIIALFSGHYFLNFVPATAMCWKAPPPPNNICPQFVFCFAKHKTLSCIKMLKT